MKNLSTGVKNSKLSMALHGNHNAQGSRGGTHPVHNAHAAKGQMLILKNSGVKPAILGSLFGPTGALVSGILTGANRTPAAQRQHNKIVSGIGAGIGGLGGAVKGGAAGYLIGGKAGGIKGALVGGALGAVGGAGINYAGAKIGQWMTKPKKRK